MSRKIGVIILCGVIGWIVALGVMAMVTQ